MKNMKDKQNLSEVAKAVKLNKSDLAILHSMESVVEGIAKMFGENCEVVLHSLEDPSHSIIKIANGHVTGREIGFPITNFAMEILNNESLLKNDSTDVYYTKSKGSKVIRSISIVIRNENNKPIGLLCINFDLSAPLYSFIREFSPSSNARVDEPERFTTSVEELVNNSLAEALSKIDAQRGISNTNKNKLIVFELFNKGIFSIKGAIDLVAKEMGISRYTVYNYIREANFKLRSGNTKIDQDTK